MRYRWHQRSGARGLLCSCCHLLLLRAASPASPQARSLHPWVRAWPLGSAVGLNPLMSAPEPPLVPQNSGPGAQGRHNHSGMEPTCCPAMCCPLLPPPPQPPAPQHGSPGVRSRGAPSPKPTRLQTVPKGHPAPTPPMPKHCGTHGTDLVHGGLTAVSPVTHLHWGGQQGRAGQPQGRQRLCCPQGRPSLPLGGD